MATGWDEDRNIGLWDNVAILIVATNQSGCFFDELSCPAMASRLVPIFNMLVTFNGGFTLNRYTWVAA